MSENTDLAKRFDALARAWTMREESDKVYTYITMEGPEGARREVKHEVTARDLATAARALWAMPVCSCTGESQDAGGGYFEYLPEPDPECPEHFPQNALGGVTRDEIARVIAPEDWALSDAPQYAHLPDAARDGLRRNSREAAERVRALLAAKAAVPVRATVTPEMEATFKGAWHAADARMERGGRVRAGLAAVLAMDPGEQDACPYEAWLVDTNGRPLRCADCGDPLPEDHEVTAQRVKREADIQKIIQVLRSEHIRPLSPYRANPDATNDRNVLREGLRGTQRELRDLMDLTRDLIDLLDQGGKA